MAQQDFNMEHHWLPFTPNRSFKKDPRVFVAAEGMHFTTHDGKQVLDGISSLWCVGAGHNRKPINEAIKKQLDTLDYATAFQASNDQAFKAADMIAAMAPGDLNKVLFCNSGSEPHPAATRPEQYRRRDCRAGGGQCGLVFAAQGLLEAFARDLRQKRHLADF